MASRVTERLAPETMLPAIGQGVIGVECRAGDTRVDGLIAALHDADTHVRVRAERALNRRLHGGCQVPIAGYATLEEDRLRLRALVARPDGGLVIRGEAVGGRDQPEALGIDLAEDLLGRGAAPILEQLHEHG
jgi:hydroxymethylbilane synthase